MSAPALKTATKRRDEASPSEDVAPDDYTFPERILVDEATYAELQSRIENPRPPSAALRALFKK